MLNYGKLRFKFACLPSIHAVYKIDLCEIEIENTSNDLLNIQYEPVQDRIVIQQNGNFTKIEGRPNIPRFDIVQNICQKFISMNDGP